jgi:hypothetical protein
MIFSGMNQYHRVFRSCNVGSKENKWCGECPKCLFTWIILSPFLGDSELHWIFGKDIGENLSLKHLLEQLTGMADEKPFECVGTMDEVIAALSYTITKRDKENSPALLDWYYRNTDIIHDPDQFYLRAGTINSQIQHNLSLEEFNYIEQILRNAAKPGR